MNIARTSFNRHFYLIILPHFASFLYISDQTRADQTKHTITYVRKRTRFSSFPTARNRATTTTTTTSTTVTVTQRETLAARSSIHPFIRLLGRCLGIPIHHLSSRTTPTTSIYSTTLVGFFFDDCLLPVFLAACFVLSPVSVFHWQESFQMEFGGCSTFVGV